MKVLMISLDNSISDRRSDSVSRMKKYAALVAELHILVFGGQGGHWSEGNLFIYSVPTNSKIAALGAAKIAAFLAARKIGAGIVKKNQINVITSQDPFFTGLLGLMLKKKNAGLNVELHGDYFSSKFWHDRSPWWPFRLALGKFVLRRADGIRAVSERIRKNLIDKQKIPAEKITKIPVYAAAEVKITESAVDLHSKFHTPWIIMCVGNLRLEKNYIAAARAMLKILESCPGAHLIIIGSGPEERRLRGYVGRHGLEESVHFFGQMSHDKMIAHLRQADVCLIPSLTESWSRVAVEAAALGVPVAMSDVGLAGEVIVGGVSGEVVGAADPQKLAEAVAGLLRDGNLRTRYAAAAKSAIAKLPTEAETLNLIKESWEKVGNTRLN